MKLAKLPYNMKTYRNRLMISVSSLVSRYPPLMSICNTVATLESIL